MTSSSRLKEIDFLRGIAVILVLFRHHSLFSFTENMGWIGVDLFFVLSGFLVSGLLFKEYLLRKKVNSMLFLIRRGFKIYPVYYFALLLTLVLSVVFSKEIIFKRYLFDVVFISNYFQSNWPHFWSLCVEEHFYMVIAVTIPLLIKLKILEKQSLFIAGIIVLLIISFTIKFIGLYFFSLQNVPFASHLRFDSLLSGVLVSYLFHFRKNSLQHFYNQYKRFLLPLCLLLISFSPFMDSSTEQNTRYINTFGFVQLYVAFNLLLIYFLFTPEIAKRIERTFGNFIVRSIAAVGVYSYSIYIFHMFVIDYLIEPIKQQITLPQSLSFIIYFSLSIVAGIYSSKWLEIPVLRLRDTYFKSNSDKAEVQG